MQEAPRTPEHDSDDQQWGPPVGESDRPIPPDGKYVPGLYDVDDDLGIDGPSSGMEEDQGQYVFVAPISPDDEQVD